jgi:Arc/MetJ family transcription regulator
MHTGYLRPARSARAQEHPDGRGLDGRLLAHLHADTLRLEADDMRTTLEIDEALLEAARHKLGARTKTETIEAALREVLEREDRVARALRLFGAHPDFAPPADGPNG